MISEIIVFVYSARSNTMCSVGGENVSVVVAGDIEENLFSFSFALDATRSY